MQYQDQILAQQHDSSMWPKSQSNPRAVSARAHSGTSKKTRRPLGRTTDFGGAPRSSMWSGGRAGFFSHTIALHPLRCSAGLSTMIPLPGEQTAGIVRCDGHRVLLILCFHGNKLHVSSYDGFADHRRQQIELWHHRDCAPAYLLGLVIWNQPMSCSWPLTVNAGRSLLDPLTQDGASLPTHRRR